MKIVIAPDSFKESLSSIEASEAIEKGFKEFYPDAEYVKVPMSDGGEGIVQALVSATNGQVIYKKVTGPLGEQVEAFFGILGNGRTAVIEMAAASGLHLVPLDKRNPLVTTTWGTGELIMAALDYNIDQIIVGIGGSSTNDGGAGMAQALGARLLNNQQKQVGYGGGELSEIATIDLSKIDRRLKEISILVASDVNNPLLGPLGASNVYGPQKGASGEIIDILEQNLAYFASIIEKELGKEVKMIPGSGAAGGLGFGLLSFLSAELKSGIDIVVEATGLEATVKNATLVITGEGKIDSQTIYGKTPIGVAKTAKIHNVPVIAIAGTFSQDYQVVYNHGIDAVFSLVPGIIPLENALENASTYLCHVSRNIAATYKIAKET